MKFGSLFAGIGGIDLGLERAGMECAWQVEIDPFCRKVLAKHWPDVPKFEDVREVGARNLSPVDVIAGGFPCQDISSANTATKRLGLGGERSGLWLEYRRVVEEMRPAVVIVENSPRWKEWMPSVRQDLVRVGYATSGAIICSSSFGTRHRRRRGFVVAYADGDSQSAFAFNAEVAKLPRPSSPIWDGWPAPPECHGMDDGVPNKSHRNRGLGNAVVPQVAEFVGRMVMEHELLGGDHA